MDILSRIRQAIQDGHYEFTDYALQQALEDYISMEEVIEAVMNGELYSTYSDDSRGPRYLVRHDMGEDVIDVVCQFRSVDSMLIIIVVSEVA
jgi:hypothetical protein